MTGCNFIWLQRDFELHSFWFVWTESTVDVLKEEEEEERLHEEVEVEHSLLLMAALMDERGP